MNYFATSYHKSLTLLLTHVAFCAIIKEQEICQTTNHCYTLYREDGGKTWEEASQYCQSLGHRLATIPDDVTQAIMRNFTSATGSKQYVWVGGKRSESWWDVTGMNYTGHIKNNKDGLWCTIIQVHESTLIDDLGIQGALCHQSRDILVICELPGVYVREKCKNINNTRGYNISNICHVVTNESFQSWEEARDHCQTEYQGTLAFRVLRSANPFRGDFPAIGTSFWMGLHRHSWTWFPGIGREQVMTYTSWAESEGVDTSQRCLVIDLNHNTDWRDRNCTENIEHVMCEGDRRLKTQGTSSILPYAETVSTSLSTQQSTIGDTQPGVSVTSRTTKAEVTTATQKTTRDVPVYYIIGGCAGGVLLLVVIIVVVVVCSRRNRRKADHKSVQQNGKDRQLLTTNKAFDDVTLGLQPITNKPTEFLEIDSDNTSDDDVPPAPNVRKMQNTADVAPDSPTQSKPDVMIHGSELTVGQENETAHVNKPTSYQMYEDVVPARINQSRIAAFHDVSVKQSTADPLYSEAAQVILKDDVPSGSIDNVNNLVLNEVRRPPLANEIQTESDESRDKKVDDIYSVATKHISRASGDRTSDLEIVDNVLYGQS